jgi:surface polysaccharide O-acyltransferase-like enzyme
MIHVSVGQVARAEILNTFSWYVNLIYWTSSWYAVPVFFMISGMFNLRNDSTDSKSTALSIKKMLKKSFKIFCALVFWYVFDCIYIPITKMIVEGTPFSTYDILRIPNIILSNERSNHLWYLYTLIGFYLFTPVLRIFTNNASKKDLEYFLLLVFVFGICIPFHNKINGQINSFIWFFPSTIAFSLSQVSGYIGYYVAGLYFSKYPIKKLTSNILICIGGTSLLLAIIGTSIISVHYGHFDYTICDHIGPLFIFISFATFLMYKNGFVKIQFSKNQIKNIKQISKCTFGIYLVHWFVLNVFNYIGIKSTLFMPVLSVPLVSLLIMTCSYIITVIIKHMPILKEYIV